MTEQSLPVKDKYPFFEALVMISKGKLMKPVINKSSYYMCEDNGVFHCLLNGKRIPTFSDGNELLVLQDLYINDVLWEVATPENCEALCTNK